MRYPEEHKDDTRRRLLALASRLVRNDGVGRSSVARLMASAKMTVGGFYRHFASQDAMLGEALATALHDVRPLLFAGLDDLEGADFERAFVGRYLSNEHFGEVAGGCPVAANVSELSRTPSLFAEEGPLAIEIASFLTYVEERVIPSPTARARAWMILAACVGGVALARAQGPIRGPGVLKALRAGLLQALHGSPPSARLTKPEPSGAASLTSPRRAREP